MSRIQSCQEEEEEILKIKSFVPNNNVKTEKPLDDTLSGNYLEHGEKRSRGNARRRRHLLKTPSKFMDEAAIQKVREIWTEQHNAASFRLKVPCFR